MADAPDPVVQDVQKESTDVGEAALRALRGLRTPAPGGAETELPFDRTLSDAGAPEAATAWAAGREAPGEPGRYETLSSLGQGGMGEVLLCKDSLLGREIAMKVIAGGMAMRDDARARFEHEARVQAQLEHPAVVPVYDIGVAEKGGSFFTMRCVRGLTLEEVLEAHRLGDAEAQLMFGLNKLLTTFVRVCLAVQYAHECGVIHRDLKPANVMLGQHGEVYVLDWGLAKVQARPGLPVLSAPTAATTPGILVGTLAFMAPEQLGSRDVDERTDVYALGAILFEILTLEPLHRETSWDKLLQRLSERVEARASLRAPQRLIPPELDEACGRATAFEPDDRWQSAAALAGAIERYLEGDRDVELRRRLAAEHLGRARGAADRALAATGQLADRSAALRELGRAIALDPEDGAALEMFAGLLTQPPLEAPPEVHEAVDRGHESSLRRLLPRAAWLLGLGAVMTFVNTILIPVGLTWIGAHPMGLESEGGRAIRIVAPAVDFPPEGTLAVLTLIYVVTIVTGFLLASRYRDALGQAELKNHLQAWQLRQLVSGEPDRSGASLKR